MTPTVKPATAPALRRAVAPIRGLQLRAGEQTGDGALTIQGHAAVFDTETVLFDAGWWRLREVISPGAFTAVLSRDPLVHLVHQHDMATAIAATDVADGIGRLELEQDDQGLRFFARVDPDDPDVRRLEAKMRRGVVGQASFAFTIARSTSTIEVDEDGNEDELWTIEEIGELYDVSTVAQGAYSATDAQMLARALARELPDLGRPPTAGTDTTDVASAPGPVGVPAVAPDPPAGGERAQAHARAALRARARVAIATAHRR